MKLTWIGHACFKIESNGYALVIDPYQDGSVPGLLPVRETAQQVLCSHGHGDHAGRETVQVIQAGESALQVETISTYHDAVQGAQRGPNQIFRIRDGQHTAAHLGDLGCELTPVQKEQLKHLDVLMIPVGGFYTIDGAQAARLVRELNPRIVIPMHYRDDEKGFGFDKIGTVSEFAESLDSVTALSASEVDLDAAFPSQVLILVPRNKITKA